MPRDLNARSSVPEARAALRDSRRHGKPATATAIGSALAILTAMAAVGAPTVTFGQAITVTSPNTCIVLDPGKEGGRTATIAWTSRNVRGNVAVDLSRNGGSTWRTIWTSTPNDGNESWRIEGTATATGMIRVRDLVPSSGRIWTASDQSDSKFVIFGPYVGPFPGGYCTAHAAAGFNSVAPSPGANWSGNAGSWLANASNAGWRTTTSVAEAANGSVLVWSDGSFGHVARLVSREYEKNVLIAVNIDEMNWGSIDKSNDVHVRNAITANFGIVTTSRLLVRNLNRGSYTFKGFIIPVRK